MIYILLPAYNEEKSIDTLFKKIDIFFKQELELKYKILICNDGSTDLTIEKIEYYTSQYPIQLINHKINRGLGETMRDLIELAAELSNPSDIIIRMDCDDTHEPQYIKSMLSKINEGYDVVIASRFQKGGGQKGLSLYRRILSRTANLCMKLVFPIKNVKEYSCGFRAYKASIIKKAIGFYGNNFQQLKGLGFTSTLEKLVKLKLINASFSEVPFNLYYNQKKSPSKMVSSITTLGYGIIVLLYYWPFGGWRRTYRKKITQTPKLWPDDFQKTEKTSQIRSSSCVES